MTELTMSQFANKADYEKAVEREELRALLLSAAGTVDIQGNRRLTYGLSQVLDFAQLVLAREREKQWIPVTQIDRLPDFGMPVFMRFPNGSIRLGGRVYDSDGWLWCRCYGDPSFDNGKWDAEMEADDDYQPTHFQYLPRPLIESK